MKGIRKPGNETEDGSERTRNEEFAGRATTPVGAASSACRRSTRPTRLALVPARTYLYAIAALDGPARWMTSKRLKPTSRHHFSKSAAE